MIDYDLLEGKIRLAYEKKGEQVPEGKSLEVALKIFKAIKEMDRMGENGEVSYKKELMAAKMDLSMIFGVSNEEINSMSKNRLYMDYQARMVNAIFMRRISE